MSFNYAEGMKDILSEKVLFMIRIRYLLSRTCITMRLLIYPGLGPQCTREMHTFLFWRPHWPESPASPGPQRYVSNDPGDFKSNICDIYFTQIASRLTRIVGCRLIICPGGDDNFSGWVARGRVWVATQFRMRRGGWYNNETSWHLTPDVNADTILLHQ